MQLGPLNGILLVTMLVDLAIVLRTFNFHPIGQVVFIRI